jgi:hypothetical protein
MKKTILALIVFLSVVFFSCKKYVQQQEENELINIVTNGLWHVQLYQQDTTDITNSFSGFNFQFRTDGTVTGTKNSVSITGVWAADINNRTITSGFPAGSGTLNNLDGVWKITDSGVDYVVSNMKAGSITDNLKLKKN